MNLSLGKIKLSIFIFGILFILVPCYAQDLTPSPSVDLGSAPETNEASPYPSVRSEFLYYDQAWFPFLITLSERNKTEALRILDLVYKAKLDYGDKNSSSYSYALIALADEQETEGDIDTATQLIDNAIKLSPSIPTLYFKKAAFLWRNQPSQLYEIIHLYVTGIRLSSTDITTATTFGANAALVIIIALLAVFALFSLSLAMKYLLPAANDIKERFEWNIPLLMFAGFIAVGLIFIFSLNIGLIWLIIVTNLFFLVYYTKTEKKLFAVFYFMLIAAPLILTYTSALMLSTHRDAIDEIIQIKNDSYTLRAEKALTNWSAQNPDDIDVLFTLGVLNKRQGYLDYARKFYQQVIDLDPASALAMNNLGTTYFVLQDYTHAEELFHSANDADPDLVAPYYNLYKVGMTRFDLSTSEQYYDKAMALDPNRITSFLEIEVKDDEGKPTFLERTNRMVIDEDIPDSSLWKRVFTMTEPKELSTNLLAGIMKGMGLRTAPIVGVICLLLLMISGSLASRSVLSKFCKFCGLPFLLKSQPHMERRDSCNRCFSLYVRKEGVDPRTKADLRMKVDRINHIRRIVLILVNFLIPGFGMIYRGKVWRGFVFLSLFVLFFVELLTVKGIVIYPVKALGLPIIHSPILYGIICFIIYLFAQKDFIKSELFES